MRNKGNRRRSSFNPRKKGEDFSLVPKCYECDQPGHLRVDCPIYKRRMEKPDKKNFKDKKGKKAKIGKKKKFFKLNKGVKRNFK